MSSLEGPCVTVLPVIVSYIQSFLPPCRKEFAAVMAARVVEGSLLSLSLGFSLQLLMLLIVLPNALLGNSLSLRAFVVVFSLTRILCDNVFFYANRSTIYTADGHVAVTRIQVHVVDPFLLLRVQCVHWEVLCRNCCIFSVLYCTVLYYTLLYCIVLYSTLLYCTVLYCIVHYYIALLHCTVVHCTVF